MIEPQTIIRPQPGPQEMFLSTPADIAIYGGAAGGGKTWAALIEPMRHVTNGEFEAVILRRTRPQITQAGGLLSESEKVYPDLGGKCNLSSLKWEFPSGASVQFKQMQHEKSKLEWQGAQLALCIFDELTHFTEGQFFYLVSRMRSDSGVRPYMRGTCNPDSDSWVAALIAWWIDQDTGYAIPERSGVVRWFVRDGDDLLWGDSPEDLRAKVPHWDDSRFRPKSFTFIAATVYDNLALLANDPDYLSNLMALPLVEREQLLGGNWKIRASAGMLFREDWVTVIDTLPADIVRSVRWWDLAGTEPTAAQKKNDKGGPDWTVGLRLDETASRRFIVSDVVRIRETPDGVKRAIKNTAAKDGRKVRIGIPQDPGQAGKYQARDIIKMLSGYDIRAIREEGTKTQRFGPFSAQCEAGNVDIMKGVWNRAFFAELVAFPDSKFKDQADGCSGAHMMMQVAKSKVPQGH